MTYKNFGRALTLLAGFGFAACGGSTTINFVGDPDSTGGEGGEGTGGGDDTGGTGMGGDGTGGGSDSGGGGPIILGYCGDGLIDEADEVCDDGNERSRDGCDAACEVETPFICSGEPSVCTLLGNGQVDAGEQCDDGNTEDGDGCSSTADVEGTCEEPQLLQVVDTGLGTSTAVVTADTSAGGASAPAQACSGLILGAASDRTYRLLTGTESEFPENDITVTVEADFDAILRIYGSYDGSTCDPNVEAFCVDEAGAGEGETWRYKRMPGGAEIVILVDGAEEGEEGEFTLTVTEGCHVDHVKLHRLTPFWSGTSATPVLSLKNVSNYCSVNLDRIGLTTTDDNMLVDVDLPNQILAPGEVFRGSFDVLPAVNPNSFDFEEEHSYFDDLAAGAYLCDGVCDRANGSNVVDAVLTGTGVNLPLPTVTFQPGQVSDVSNTPYEGYVRVAYDGVAPNFLASDWSAALLVDPDDYIFDWFDEYNDGADDLGPLGFTSDAQEGTVLSTPVPTTPGSYSAYGANVPAATAQATYVSFKVKTGDDLSGGSSQCFTALGIDSGLGTSAAFTASYFLSYAYWYQYSGTYGSYAYWAGSTGTLSAQPANIWMTVEFENIDWTNHTMDVRVDGTVVSTAVAMVNTAQNAVGVFSIRPWLASTCHYSDIIVRNGPPGRIWESPPVLVAPD